MNILLIARDRSGREVARQTVTDEETANRLMIARNRPLKGEQDFPRWAIEERLDDLISDHSAKRNAFLEGRE